MGLVHEHVGARPVPSQGVFCMKAKHSPARIHMSLCGSAVGLPGLPQEVAGEPERGHEEDQEAVRRHAGHCRA